MADRERKITVDGVEIEGQPSEEIKHLQDADDHQVQELSERIGYGNVMHSASRLWGAKLEAEGYPRGNHTVGPCEALTVTCPHPERDVNGHCTWCCGCGWVTERVFEIMKTIKPS